MTDGEPAAVPSPRSHRPPRGEPVLRRAVRLLAAFDDDHRHLALGALAVRAGLPLSTASRLAAQLVGLGVLDRARDGTFGIGLRLWEIASLAETTVSLRGAVAPLLDDLVAVTRHHVQLVVRDGEEGLVLDRRDGRDPLPVHYHVGGHLPLVPTAAGQVLLAAAPRGLVEEMLARGTYGWPTVECPRPAPDEVRAQVTEVRRTDLAVVRRPAAPVVSLGVPVRDRTGQVVAAIGVVLPAEGASVPRLEPVLRAAARAATRAVSAGEKERPPDWSRG
ncbi:IclR family transcriptional regulator [Cellulomonas oligotrophica]|uniref:IclR family transcriptional regulator n=1 Tax=Cellulomonas oligotrophica TaxID=931536 RepID=A0ABQ4D5J2_9CELL|nr:IclR family transcriptional regulator [Cellulomonas oligotrophica]